MGKEFLGTGWKFPVQVDPSTGRIMLSQHEEDIAEAIRIILWTARGERVMRPDFGSGVHQYSFEENDFTILSMLENDLERSIREWEPRVENVKVKAIPDGGGKLNIHVSYTVRTTNNLFNQVYPFYLYEGSK
jgi:phage baseplate assembly protein W